MISNIPLVPVPILDVTPETANSIRISWATNVADHILESAAHLPPAEWSTVTNALVISGDRLSVIVETTDAPQRFFRLRKP